MIKTTVANKRLMLKLLDMSGMCCIIYKNIQLIQFINQQEKLKKWLPAKINCLFETIRDIL